MITQIKLDESTKLEFGVSITGADGVPQARFIIEGSDFSLMFPCKQVNENVEVKIPELKKFFKAGEYSARLEIILDNKLYTPLTESILFEPTIEIASTVKPVKLRESVKVSSITVKKSELNEHLLRKTQAATIVAQALHYVPEKGETPAEIIEHAIEQSPPMTPEQTKTLNDMLDLAESTGISFDRDSIKTNIVIIEERKKEEPATDDSDISDEEMDDMVSNTTYDDVLDTYDDHEIAIVDDETGEALEESTMELNEVLSRAERVQSRMRMARTKTKREAKMRIALKKRSSGAVLNRRARHLAVKAIELKIAKKPLASLSIPEKERVERIIARKKMLINRLALRMIPRVKQIEKDRLSHPSFTQN